MKKKMILLALMIYSFVAYPQNSENNDNLLQERESAILAGNPEEAVEIFQKCVQSHENSEEMNPEGANCLMNLAQAHEQKEDFVLALETYQKSAEIYEASGEEVKLAVTNLNIGRMNQFLGP